MPRKPTRREQCSNNGNCDKGKKKKGRGPGKSIDPPDSEEQRPILIIEGARFRREPYQKDKNISLLIGQIIRSLYPGQGVQSYSKEWSGKLKEASFHEFTRCYKFHDNVRIEEARKLFDYRANRMLTQNLYGARSDAIEATGSEDPRDWTDSEPYWIVPSAWKLLIREWCDEYFKALSGRNTNNRLAPGDNVAFATTGSLSILDYKHQMMSENGGREPDMEQVFVRTHTKKKTGQLVSDKAKKTQESVREARKKKYGDDPAEYPPWDLELWYDATGGRPHGHLYGMGGAVDNRVPRKTHHVHVPTQTYPPPGYVDIDTVDKLIQNEREEALKREAMLKEKQDQLIKKERGKALKREAKQERRFFGALQQAMQQSRVMFMQEMQAQQNDGASTSRQYVDNYNGHDPNVLNVHEQANTSAGVTHYRSNWCNQSDDGDSSSDEEIILESSDEE